jgi:hypothetical protein
MSYQIKGTKISMTRGDTVRVKFNLKMDGEDYLPSSDDVVRFAVKARWCEKEPLLIKQIPSDTMVLQLDPEDTKSLPFGQYWYDVQITFGESGDVITFIERAKLRLTEEVE